MLSIIIPTLQEEAYIGKLLSSIGPQDGEWEVILVDGGSKDHTIDNAIAAARQSNIPLTVKKLPDAGVAHQRNYGVKYAQGDWLLFLDADVLLPPDFLKHSLAEIKKRDILVAGVPFYAAERYFVYRLAYWIYAKAILPLMRLNKPILHGCCIFIRKDLHEQLGGFTSGITFEDYDYSIRAASFSRPTVLKQTYVRTSARRFYNLSWSSLVELIRGTVSSALLGKKVKNEQMVEFHKKDGDHPLPRY